MKSRFELVAAAATLAFGCVSGSAGSGPSVASSAADAGKDSISLADATTATGDSTGTAADAPTAASETASADDALAGETGAADTGDGDAESPTDAADTLAPDTTPPGCQSSADCDDGDFCTADTCNADGSCAHAPVANCIPPPMPCNAQNPCATGVCDTATWACVGCLAAADCPKGSLCQNKQCKPAQVCKSDVDCKATKQVCSKSAALCVDCNTAADCDANQACVDTKCVGAVACKSSKDCPAVCNKAKGVCADCETTDDCPAGKFCAADGKCLQAVCAGNACGSGKWLFGCKADGSAYLPGQACDDNNLCTDTGCTGSKGCLQISNAAACDDGSKCTESDACANGLCGGKAVPCNDANPCTDDLCDPKSGCKYVSNTAKCDDNSTCTQNDACTGGVCKGAGVNCDDGNPCTSDDCDAKQSCLHANNTAACTDGNACTDGDLCKDGNCNPGPAKTCDDSNSCTADACDPTAGCKFVAKGGSACDDGNKCTFNDACAANGQCVGAAGNCDDQNPCTDNACDPKIGCTFAANSLPCDDKNPCTGGDKCGGGKCQPGTGTACDDGNACTDQGCDLAKGGCYFTANAGPCDDGNACTAGDKCQNGKCFSGSSLTCDDKNACTTDWCDVVKGCVFAGTGACDDKDPCTTDSCDAATGACSHGTVANCCQANAVLYKQSFDNGTPPELTATNSTGLAKKGWQVWDPAQQSVSGKGVLYYGDPATAKFDFGVTSSGTAVISVGNLPPTGKRKLTLQMWFDAEKYTAYDQITLWWQADGKTQTTLWTKEALGTNVCGTNNGYTCAKVPSGWFEISVDLPAGYTANTKLGIKFDTVDAQNNATLGVLIDDIKVTQAACN